jgi:hypothetical protein
VEAVMDGDIDAFIRAFLSGGRAGGASAKAE